MPDDLRKEVQKRLELLNMGKVSECDGGASKHVVSSYHHKYHNNYSKQHTEPH